MEDNQRAKLRINMNARHTHPPDLPWSITYFAFIALILAYVWPFLAPGAVRSIGPDNEYTLGAMVNHIARSLAGGVFPLRMETIMGGFPLYNNPQVNGLYPFYHLFDFSSLSPFDLIRSLHRLMIFHLVVLAANSYFFMRVIGASRIASLIGIVFIALSPQANGLAKWANCIGSFSWLPLFLAGVLLTLEHKKTLAGAMAMSIALFFMASAQSAQAPILAAYLTLVIFVTRIFFCKYAQCGESNTSQLGRFALASVIVVLVSAPVVLPVLAAMPESIRWIHEGHVIGLQPIPFDQFLIDQLALADASAILFPIPSPRIITNAYIGIIPLVFCTFLLLNTRQPWIVGAFAIVGLHSMFSVFGENLGLAYLNYHLPLINKIREPSYFLVPLSISIGCLAALGIDAFRNQAIVVPSPSKLALPLLFTLALVGIPGLISSLWHVEHIALILGNTLFAIALASLPLVYQRFRKAILPSLRSNVFWLAVILIVGALSFLSAPRHSDTISHSQYILNNQVALDSVLLEVRKLDPEARFRVIFGGKIGKQEAAMRASFHGIRTLNSSIGPAPLKQFEQMYFHEPRPGNYFSALGARYLICHECSAREVDGFTPVVSIGEYQILESSKALPNYYFAERFIGLSDSLYDYEMMINRSGLLQIPLVVDRKYESVVTAFVNGASMGKCRLIEFGKNSNSISFSIACRDTGVFVLNEFFSGDWQAFVDGVEVPAFSANGNQIGVLVPAGTHFLSLEFSPRILHLSWLLFLVGTISMVILWRMQSEIRSHGLKQDGMISRTDAPSNSLQ